MKISHVKHGDANNKHLPVGVMGHTVTRNRQPADVNIVSKLAFQMIAIE